MSRHIWLAFCGILLCCSGSDKQEQSAVDRQSLLRQYAVEVVMPAYENAQTASETFATKTQALCDGPSAKTLTAAQDAWQAAHVAWEKTQVHAFGPVLDLRLDSKIDFWPRRADKIEEFYTANETITSALVASQGSLVRGFAVAEYLLFVEHEDTLLESTKRCAFAQSIASVLKDDVSAVASEWSTAGGNFGELLQTAGKGSTAYPKQQQALDALLNTMIASLQNWESMKLSKPIGRQDGGTPQPDEVESPDAQISKELLVANLQGFQRAFLGGETRAADSLAAVIAADDPDLVANIEAETEKAIATLQGMEDSLKVAVVASAPEPEAAFTSLKQLLQWLAVDVAGKLGVTPTFSDNDGD